MNANRARTTRHRQRNDAVYRGPWKRIRRTVLERDQHLCQIRDTNCTTTATEVDHIIPVELGGSWWDLDNLQAACRPCNIAKGNRTRNQAWIVGPPITLVYGPPGAGKSSYVKRHAQPGDLVIDYDDLGHALGSPTRTTHTRIHPVINAARNAALQAIRRAEHNAPAVWIISANPKAPTLFPHHTLVHLHPGRDIVITRAVEGGRTPNAIATIDHHHQPSAIWGRHA